MYLDEVGCWHPPLLKVLLPMLLLDLQGKARAQDALRRQGMVAGSVGRGQEQTRMFPYLPI